MHKQVQLQLMWLGLLSEVNDLKPEDLGHRRGFANRF
jgi:hypothetical protein